MNQRLRAILGLSPAAILRGLRFGVRDLYRAGHTGFEAVNPLGSVELRGIPQVALGAVLGSQKPWVKLQVMQYEDGMLPLRDAIPLLALLVADNPREVLEIGTFMGHTTRAMAENLDGATIHTVDLPPEFSATGQDHGALPKDDFHLISKRIVGREFKGRDCESRIVQHFGDTAELDFGKLGQPTFFFIDGSHTYEYCRNDSEKCFALCGGKGTFLWHDCDEIHPGVARLITEWRRQGRDVVRLEGTSLAYWKSS
jgi:hypothetical protein